MFAVQFILSIATLMATMTLFPLAGRLEADARRHGNRLQPPSSLASYERGRLVIYWILGRAPSPDVPVGSKAAVWLARALIVASSLVGLFGRYLAQWRHKSTLGRLGLADMV